MISSRLPISKAKSAGDRLKQTPTPTINSHSDLTIFLFPSIFFGGEINQRLKSISNELFCFFHCLHQVLSSNKSMKAIFQNRSSTGCQKKGKSFSSALYLSNHASCISFGSLSNHLVASPLRFQEYKQHTLQAGIVVSALECRYKVMGSNPTSCGGFFSLDQFLPRVWTAVVAVGSLGPFSWTSST